MLKKKKAAAPKELGPRGGVRGPRDRSHRGASNRFNLKWAKQGDPGEERSVAPQPADLLSGGGPHEMVFVCGVVHSDSPKTVTMLLSCTPGEHYNLGVHLAALLQAHRNGTARPPPGV